MILQAFYDAPKLTDAKAEEMRIVKAAADLIKNDIKCISTTKDAYPIPDEIASIDKNIEFLPQSLRLLLRTIFTEKKAELKIASIGQSITQAARPLYHHFRLDLLYRCITTSDPSSLLIL